MLGTGWWIGYFADDAGDADEIMKMRKSTASSRTSALSPSSASRTRFTP
jgi:hypothetical protein